MATINIPPALHKHDSDAQKQLLTHVRLLHLLHHRNKNQHRRSHWYRDFNTLRTESRKLANELGIELGAGLAIAKRHESTNTTNAKSKSHPPLALRVTLSTSNVTARLDHWMTSGLIEKCFAAFSSLSATPSFSPLALTLLAILARVCSITGITTAYQAKAKAAEEREAQQDEEQLGRMLAKFASEHAGELYDAFADKSDLGIPVQRKDNDRRGNHSTHDFVTVVQRPVDSKLITNPAPASKKRPSVSSSGQPKKKKKKTNAIDDLFAGL